MAYISPEGESILFNIDLAQYGTGESARTLKITRMGPKQEGFGRLRIVTHGPKHQALIRMTKNEAFQIGMALVEHSGIDDQPYRKNADHLSELDEIDAALED